MLTLYTFGPAFGLPDPSPFCVKADVLMQMSGLAYETARMDVRKAPKQKLPVLKDGDETIPDSSFIRMHLEQKHAIDFDPGLTPAQKGTAWAIEKFCEDHLYWAVVHARWTDNANFNAGPRSFFDAVPALLRPLIIAKVRSDVRRTLWGQGFGRHSRADVERLAIHGYAQLAAILGDKPFLMGQMPCGADATVFGWVGSILCPLFDTPIRTAAEKHPNLIAYRDRCLARWYPGRSAAAA